jgi:ATP-dependent protease HslVU (ClpYQ) ATPase subunit
MNYSVDTLKKAAFHDELENVLKVLAIEAPDRVDENIVTVMEYLKKRLKEIDSNYKN